MKRYKVLLDLPLLFLVSVAAYAQSTEDTLTARRLVIVPPQTVQGTPQHADPALDKFLFSGDRRVVRMITSDRLELGGAWWTNAALVQRLGITDDQKAKIERVFENHRANLELQKGQLEKEELLLARFLDAEPFDRNAALSQVYRVIQARSDMEKSNALMTMEMREYLTRAQWTQLPRPSVSLSYLIREVNPSPGNQNTPRGAGGRGARGQ